MASETDDTPPAASTPPAAGERPRRKGQLHRSDVLNAAIELLDEVGLDELSTRKLATRLGVQSGAVFWHFATKQALLNAMADHLLAGVAEIDAAASGLDQLREIGVRFRAALKAHRDGARLVSGTFVREVNTLALGNVSLTAAIAVGIPADRAVLVTTALQYYVQGQTVEEQALEELIAAGGPRESIDPDVFPEAAHGYGDLRQLSADERFDYGLTLLLNGVALEAGAEPFRR